MDRIEAQARKTPVTPSDIKKAPGTVPDPGSPFEGALDIRLHPEEGKLKPAAELLLSDPRGKRAGKDPRANRTYQEIPATYYERESLADASSGAPGPETAVLYVRNPPNGKYRLQVIGRAAGKYDLEITGEDRASNPSKAQFTNVKIRKGAVHHYVINYSNRPGAQIEVTAVQARPTASSGK
jgi:hypothetical protein